MTRAAGATLARVAPGWSHGTVSLQKNPKLAFAFLPGTLFWGLLIGGMVTKNNTLIGAGVILGLATAIFVITIKVRQASARQKEQQRIIDKGLRGVATVVALTPTGSRLNQSPQVNIELDVRADGATGAPVRATAQLYISVLVIPRVQPGCEIPVHVDPDDHTNVVLDASITGRR